MPVFHILPFLTDTLSAYRHLLKMEHLGETMTGSLAVVTSHCGDGPTPRAEAPANKHKPLPPGPPAIVAYLARAGEQALDARDTHLSISGALPR